MISRPSLDTSHPNQGRSIAASVLSAMVVTAILCGILTVIRTAYQLLDEDESSALLVTATAPSQAPAPALKAAATPIHHPAFTQPIAPIQATFTVNFQDTQKPTTVSVPDSQPVDLDDLIFEELDTTNPFAEPKTAPTKVAKTSTSSHPREAKPQKQNQARLAALAKKITRQPSITSRATPHYPRSARRKGYQGRAVIIVTVSSSGSVTLPRILQSSGHPSLDQSALEAALKHRFAPALNGLGQPIAVQRQLPFSFKLTS